MAKIIFSHIVYTNYMYGRKRRYSNRKQHKKATRSNFARKRTYRRKTYRKALVQRQKWINPVSQKQQFKFVYSDSDFSRTLLPAFAYSAYYVFRGASPYDPDYTGVGVQPYGWDQHVGTDLYTNFRAPASKISVYFRPELTYGSMRRLQVTVIPMRTATPIMTDISDVRNTPLRKVQMYDGTTETTRSAKITSYSSIRKVTMVSPGDISWEGSYAGNPSAGWYWIVHFYATGYDDEEIDIYFDVKIKYYTTLTRGDTPNES